MKQKHLDVYIEMCLSLATLSNCPRRKFGTLLLDPKRNLILGTAYNGGPRGGGELCGGAVCLRDVEQIESGTRAERGCHHAEFNAICQAARVGTAIDGAWIITNGEPCEMCAKAIHHSGVVKVVVVGGGYSGINGLAYLQQHGIEIALVAGPQDPRGAR